MPHRAPAHKSFADRSGLYQEITDKIIAELEQGRLPWVQPWGGVRAPLALPKNASTGRAYSGITVTNDHARQEQVWESLARAYNKDPYYIIRFDKGRKHLDAVAVGRAGLGLP